METNCKTKLISCTFILAILTLALPTHADDARHKDWADLLSMGGQVQAKNGKSPLYVKAVEVNNQKSGFGPSRNLRANIQKKTDTVQPIDPKLLRLVNQGEQVINDILRTKGNINPQQEKAYDKKMYSLIKQMDQVKFAAPGDRNRAEGPAACMLDCDSAYPGFGGGNGWNRFVCKSSCIKIKVGPVGVGGK